MQRRVIDVPILVTVPLCPLHIRDVCADGIWGMRTMDSALFGVVTGFLIGLLTSLLIWLIRSGPLGPKLEFSPSISRLPAESGGTNKSGWRYRVKVRNVRSRQIIDVEFVARLSILGFRPGFPKNWTAIYIPAGAGDGRVPRLQGKQSFTMTISPHRVTAESVGYWTDDLRQRAASGTLTLDDLLDSGSEANLRVFVFGYDKLSGTRKLFESKPYSKEDIIIGTFSGTSLAVKPSRIGAPTEP